VLPDGYHSPASDGRITYASPNLTLLGQGEQRPPERKREFVFISETAKSAIFSMLSPKPQINLQSAKEYFREHLCVGDYYAEGQTLAGEWFGEAAEKLQLRGSVSGKELLVLCEGLNPATGQWLTARKNSTRNEDGNVTPNRRVFYDFTYSPPKSVSVVALYQDVRIIELHDRAVGMAMIEMEKFAATRVRKSSQDGDRETGNLIGASIQHVSPATGCAEAVSGARRGLPERDANAREVGQHPAHLTMKLSTDAGQLPVEAALARLPWKKGRRMKRKNQHEGCRRLNRTKNLPRIFTTY
jgi:hypothetical protein